MVLLILTNTFGYNYTINRIGEKLAKVTSKIKEKQSSETDIPDFKLECAKMFLFKFC